VGSNVARGSLSYHPSSLHSSELERIILSIKYQPLCGNLTLPAEWKIWSNLNSLS
jgi:hypothetical protein